MDSLPVHPLWRNKVRRRRELPLLGPTHLNSLGAASVVFGRISVSPWTGGDLKDEGGGPRTARDPERWRTREERKGSGIAMTPPVACSSFPRLFLL